MAPTEDDLAIRGDNKAALSIAAKLKVAKNSSLIGKEMAWIYTQAAFHPRYVQHVPGVTNVLADALSRITDPTKKYKIPAELKHITMSQAPLRTTNYYRTLSVET